MNHQQIIKCPSCNSLVTDKFCANCGEKKLTDHDFSKKHIAEESIEGFTHLDNKIFRTSKLLATKPGLLTRYFSEGKRVPYMKPFQLFIVCNLFFFFLLNKGNVFTINFYNYLNFDPYQSLGTKEIISEKAKPAAEYKHFATLFNEKLATQSKAFIIFFIPVFALGFALLFYSKKKYFSEHLVFAVHFFSFLLLYFIIIQYVVETPFYYFSKQSYNSIFDALLSAIHLIVFSIYLVIASRVFYRASVIHALMAAVTTAVVFAVFLFVYRMLLFYNIVYSLH